jgi:predicted aspartyl protease
MTNYRSFKIESIVGHNFRALTSSCGVSVAYNPSASAQPRPVTKNFVALWDTGATNTVISQKVVDQLKLVATSKTKAFHVNGESIVDVYYVNIMLPNEMGFNFLKVTKGILSGIDILIGMDIIGVGEFSISHVDGKSVFEFKLPAPDNI